MSAPDIQRLTVSTPIKALQLSISHSGGRCWAFLFYSSKARPTQGMAYASCYAPSNARVERSCSDGWALWIGDAAFDVAAKDVQRVAAFLNCRIVENAA